MSLLRPPSLIRRSAPGQVRPAAHLASINWAHPMANQLLFYGLDSGGNPAGYGSASLVSPGVLDLVYGSVPTKLLGPSSIVGTPYGPTVNYDGTDASYAFPCPPGVKTAQGAGVFTYACAFIMTGTVGSYTRPFCRTANNGSSGPFCNWDFEINPSGVGQTAINANTNNSGSLATTTSNGLFTSPLFTTVVGVMSGGTLTLYLNGAAGPTQSGITPASYNTQDDIIFSGSSAAAAANMFIGSVFYGAFWGRALSAAEILDLTLDPYSFITVDPLDEFAMPITVPATSKAYGMLFI